MLSRTFLEYIVTSKIRPCSDGENRSLASLLAFPSPLVPTALSGTRLSGDDVTSGWMGGKILLYNLNPDFSG